MQREFMVHPVLARQLRRLGLDPDGPPPATESWARLIERINRFYTEADQDRYLLERSLSLSSAEMQALYAGLQRSEARYRALIENASDVIAVLAADGTITSVSPSLARIAGHDPESWTGRAALDLVHPGARERVSESFQRVVARPAVHPPIEFPLFQADGSWREVEAVANNLLHDPDVGGVVYTMRDITERKRAAAALRAAEHRLRSVVANAPIFMFALDRNAVFTLNEGKGLEVMGRQVRDIVGRSVYDVFAAQPDMIDGVRRALAGETLTATLDLRGRIFEVWYAPVSEDDSTVSGVIGVATDVTARRRAELALMESEASSRLLFANNPLPMWVYDVDSLRLIEVNDAAMHAYGYTRAEFLAMRITDLHPAEDAAPAEDPHALLIRQDGPLIRRHRLKDGRVIDVSISSHQLVYAGRDAVLVVAQDVTEHRRYEAQLTYQALHDTLTGLPNRALFHDRLQHALERGQRQHRTFAVLFLDLDLFKVVNDSLGHAIGDELLVMAARRLQSCLRPGDTAARLGGDEFTVLLEDLGEPEEAVAVAERVQRALRSSFSVGGHEIVVTASVGIVVSDCGYEAPGDILRDADVAMYQAKARGRNGIAVFNSDMAERARARLELEADLRRALAQGELRLYYQPEIDLQTGDVVGMEALVRWQHPTRGLLQPQEFIALAEETGLIAEVGDWVLREACRQARAWQELHSDAARLVMSVNVSAWEFASPRLLNEIATVLKETDLAPERLRIEITESTMMRAADDTLRTLRGLKALGVRLAVDDFGTGYSSLSYLRHFPLDTLKIDRSFVQAGIEDERAAAIVRTVIALAHSLGMEVTAEGMETAAQVDWLLSLGCRYGQGYRFSRPLPEHTMRHIVSTGLPAGALDDAALVEAS